MKLSVIRFSIHSFNKIDRSRYCFTVKSPRFKETFRCDIEPDWKRNFMSCHCFDFVKTNAMAFISGGGGGGVIYY
jgi:hypothetical protein